LISAHHPYISLPPANQVDRPALPPSSHTAAYITTPPQHRLLKTPAFYMFYTNSLRSSERWFFVINFKYNGFCGSNDPSCGEKSGKGYVCG
jgi:hypothetical protein